MSRNEFPNPQLERSHWTSLHGIWNFAFDDLDEGHLKQYWNRQQLERTICVPFVFQSELSTIHDLTFHDHIWYQRHISIDESYHHQQVVLHFGACDYYTEVYVNGQFIGSHEGGYSSFEMDITNALNFQEENIVLYVHDPSTDETIPRGKQYWKEQHESIWYPRSSGIWQPVWLEYVDKHHIKEVRFTPNIDNGSVSIYTRVSTNETSQLHITIWDDKKVLSTTQTTITEAVEITIPVFGKEIFHQNVHHAGNTWSPENPKLYSVEIALFRNQTCLDSTKSYFGMRKIHIEDDVFYLNNRPYFQKLILDQGYYPKSLLTAPSDEDFINDICLAKEMGFNGARRHQLVSDPRYLYHADRLGFLVWGEMANAVSYDEKVVKRMMNEWTNVILRDYNHPCIVTWVPLNESWGVPQIAHDKKQQHHALALYSLTKSLDNTRPVISNDGWEMVDTDVCGIHNYAHGTPNDQIKRERFIQALQDKDGMLSIMSASRCIFATGFQYENQPIMLTEFGGIAFENGSKGWGYTSVQDGSKFLSEYRFLIETISKSDCIRGFCYTQFTDVFQEENGLLTFDRKPKVPLSKIKELNDMISKPVLRKQQVKNKKAK